MECFNCWQKVLFRLRCNLNFLFLVLFKNGGWWVFNLFVSGVNHGNEEAMRVQDFFALPQEWKDLPQVLKNIGNVFWKWGVGGLVRPWVH